MKKLSILLLTTLVVMISCTPNAEKVMPNFANSDFYDTGGKFIEEKAKEAILQLANYHGYNIFS